MKYILTLFSTSLASLLLVASPIPASAHGLAVQADLDTHVNSGLHLGSLFHFGSTAEVRTDMNQKDSNSWDYKQHREHDNRHATSTSAERPFMAMGTVSAVNGTTFTLDAKNGTTYTVAAAGARVKGGTLAEVATGDEVVVFGTATDTAVSAKAVFDSTLMRAKFKEARSHVSAGVVTSVDGATFTIKPYGDDKATTTITTGDNTVFKADGEVATSGSLAIGDRVVAYGTTTASTSTSTSFTASLVRIFTHGFVHMKHWFWF